MDRRIAGGYDCDLTMANGSEVPSDSIPVVEIEELGPVARINHIAYRPWPQLAHVPGTGTGNLAYVPDFLLSAPEYFAGNFTQRKCNAIMVTGHATMVVALPTRLEGIGGLVAGQTILQPLLGVETQNDMDTGMYLNS